MQQISKLIGVHTRREVVRLDVIASVALVAAVAWFLVKNPPFSL